MKKKVAAHVAFSNPLVSDRPTFSMKWMFSSSHWILALFSSLGVFALAYLISSFFSVRIFVFLFSYLILHMWLIFDYYYDRSIDEKFLVFFYFFSIAFFVLLCVFYLV